MTFYTKCPECGAAFDEGDLHYGHVCTEGKEMSDEEVQRFIREDIHDVLSYVSHHGLMWEDHACRIVRAAEAFAGIEREDSYLSDEEIAKQFCLDPSERRVIAAALADSAAYANADPAAIRLLVEKLGWEALAYFDSIRAANAVAWRINRAAGV